MNVFGLCDQLYGDYSEYVRSYIQIRDARIRDPVHEQLREAMLWPEALILRQFVPEGTRNRILLPLVFRREAGQEFYTVLP